MSTCAKRHTHYLDAVLEQEPWRGEALLLVERLTENDDLLKEEDPPLLAARQEPCILLRDQERVLQEQLALGNNFTLKRGKGGKGRGERNIAF